MLILNRKAGETILLDGAIAISVLAIEGKRVKIGILAPLDVQIVREELLHRNPSSSDHQTLPSPSIPNAAQ